MHELLLKLHRYKISKQKIKYMMITNSVLFMYICCSAFLLVVFCGDELNRGGLLKHTNIQNPLDLIGILIFAPIIETWLFQAVIITTIYKKTNNSRLAIGISALAFSALHWKLPLNAVIQIVPGVIFAYTYWLYQFAKKDKGFFMTMGIHSVHNLLILIAAYGCQQTQV